MKPAFESYIGIDYSGAETCESSLKALRVYIADRANEPREVVPPPSPRWYWSRKQIAHWLVERLSTLLDAVGAPLGTVQALLGHASPDITRQIYLHTIPVEQPRAVEEVEKT